MPQDGRKMVFDRIQMTENCFGDLCSELSSFTKKKARLRDKYDELAGIFKTYADSVRFNETLFNGIINYSKACTQMGDIKDVEVQRLQAKTLRDLAAYEHVCKNAREALKQSMLARGKEHLKQRNQRNSEQNAQLIEQNKSSQDFEVNLMKFERQKISDMRQILLDFTMIQLKDCIKSMEILTEVYNDVSAIDADKDLQEFELNFLNKGWNNLKASNRSQSLSALASNPQQPLKRTNLSNSTMSLSSPNKNNHNMNGATSNSNSDSEETSKSTEETSESEEEQSGGSSQTKQSSENKTSYSEDDDDAVEVHPIKSMAKKKVDVTSEGDKRLAPVPQVRFSKLVSHMKK